VLGPAGGLEDVRPCVDVLAGAYVAVPGRDFGGERKVGADLPERDQRNPARMAVTTSSPRGSSSQSGR
jgi:hypothetical protein